MGAGQQIRVAIESGRRHGERVRAVWDSLARIDAKVAREERRLEAAFASLRQADVMTHAWNRVLIDEQLADYRDELQLVEHRIQEHHSDRRLRPWLVAGVWIFVAVNLLVLRWRRQMTD